MLFRIAKENQERAGKAFTVEREKNNFGYKKSGILKPKSNRIMHYYEVDMIDADRIICTVRHKNNDCIVALVWLSGYTPDSIEVDQAELYRNCSNYPYRREYNEKYLKKYDQIACIVHGAIAAGLLFDTVEAPTTEETSEAAQDTTCTDKEPQEGTETVQKTTDMATFCAAYRAAYNDLYDHCGEPETDRKERFYCDLFDQKAESIAEAVRRFCVYRGDLVSSDREAAAFMIALETVGAPTDGETATDGETTTTTETDAQRAKETPRKAIQTGERLYSHPHRHRWRTTPQAPQKARRKAHRRQEPAKAGTLPPHPIQSHHEPPEVYHRATAEHAQQPHRATKRQKAYNATTDHRKRHTEPYRAPPQFRHDTTTRRPRPAEEARKSAFPGGDVIMNTK